MHLGRGQALSPIASSPSCSYMKLYYGEQWTWPKIKPRMCVCCQLCGCGWRQFCGDIGWIFGFSSPLPVWPNFGGLSASLGYLPLQTCLEALPNFCFKSESVFQQKKMVQNSKQWVSSDKINHPAPGIFSLSYSPQISLPSHPLRV